MSDHNSDSCEDGNTTSMQPYPSVWLAHWTRTAFKSENQVSSNLLIGYESGEESSQTKKRPLLHSPIPAADISRHDSGSKEEAGIGTDIPKNEILTVRSKRRKIERLDSELFPMLNVSQHREGKLALNIEQATVSRIGALKFQTSFSSGRRTLSLDGKETRSQSLLAVAHEGDKPKKEHIMSEGIKGYPDRHDSNSNNILDCNTVTFSTFVRDEVVGQSSKFVPYEMSSSRIPFTTREKNLNNQTNSYLSSKTQVGNANFCSYSTLFVQETKINQLLDSTRSDQSLSRQNMQALLMHNPSRDYEKPNLFPIQFDVKENSSSTLPIQSQSSHPDATEPEQLYHEGYTLSRVPYSDHDVETMRICTNMDSVEKTLGGPPTFSQTTHHFTISKKTDVNLFEGQEFREPTTPINLKSKGTINGKIEDSGNVRTSTACKSNESSSETDFMDIDAFQENHLIGQGTLLADEDLGSLKSPLPSASMTDSVKEIGSGLPRKNLPDMNESPPDCSASPSLMDNRESSTSKTQSLDVEHFLMNAEPPRFSTSALPLCDPAKQEFDSRWVKRLKPCDSESVHETKSSKQEETSSCDKANQLFKKTKLGATNSERSMGQGHEKKQLAVGQTYTTAKDMNSCRSNTKKNQEIILSNPWIRRWCHNTVPSESHETAVFNKPQCSKPTGDKQFPSVAAMALMGKTVTGFRSCEFSRKGSFLVWHA